MAAPVKLAALAATLLLSAAARAAGAVADPTQPPGASSPTSAAADAQSPPAASDTRLQMVIRGPGEQRTALIGGHRVRVGDQIDLDGAPARVTAIHDDHVVLLRGTQRETLELLPRIATPPHSSRGTPAGR
jgi:hypothetical protein